MVMKHIVSPFPYLFNLFYFIGRFKLTLPHSLFLKRLIFIILIALIYIFLLMGPYPFNLFQFVVSNLFFTLLVFLHWLYFILYLKYLIFIILMALLYIFLLPGPYPFNLFLFVVPNIYFAVFYINLHQKCLISFVLMVLKHIVSPLPYLFNLFTLLVFLNWL